MARLHARVRGSTPAELAQARIKTSRSIPRGHKVVQPGRESQPIGQTFGLSSVRGAPIHYRRNPLKPAQLTRSRVAQIVLSIPVAMHGPTRPVKCRPSSPALASASDADGCLVECALHKHARRRVSLQLWHSKLEQAGGRSSEKRILP